MSGLSDEDLRRLYRYAMTLTRDRDRSRDLVHTAIVRWLDSGNNPVEQPRRYMMVAVRNAYYDECRRIKLHAPKTLTAGDALEEEGGESLEDLLVREDQLQRIWRLLSDSEREILFLWAVEGFTLAEISAHTCVPRGTLLARLHRLRRRLARLDEVRLIRGAT